MWSHPNPSPAVHVATWSHSAINFTDIPPKDCQSRCRCHHCHCRYHQALHGLCRCDWVGYWLVFVWDFPIGLWTNPQYIKGGIIHELIINQQRFRLKHCSLLRNVYLVAVHKKMCSGQHRGLQNEKCRTASSLNLDSFPRILHSISTLVMCPVPTLLIFIVYHACVVHFTSHGNFVKHSRSGLKLIQLTSSSSSPQLTDLQLILIRGTIPKP